MSDKEKDEIHDTDEPEKPVTTTDAPLDPVPPDPGSTEGPGK